MGGLERKSCKVHIKNTEEQISIELIYTKRNKDVDIRDFLCDTMEKISKLKVHFKQGHYELKDGEQENVLNIVPKVIEIFQNFYRCSFGEGEIKNDCSNAKTGASTCTRELKKTEKQTIYERSSGSSPHGSTLSHNEQQKEEEAQKDTKPDILGLEVNHDEVGTATGFQNSDKRGGLACEQQTEIEERGSTQGSGQHNDPKEVLVIKYPSSMAQSAEYDKKHNENNYSDGIKREKDYEGGEHDKGKGEHHNDPKEIDKTGSTQGSGWHNDRREVNNYSSSMAKRDEYDKKCNEKYYSDGIKREKDYEGGKHDKGKGDHHNDPKKSQKFDTADIAQGECDAEKYKEKIDSIGKEKDFGSEDGTRHKTKTSQGFHTVDTDVHESDDEKLGIVQGNKGPDGSKVQEMDSDKTKNSTYENKHDEDEDLQPGSAVDTKVKLHDTNKDNKESCSAGEKSKPKHVGDKAYLS